VLLTRFAGLLAHHFSLLDPSQCLTMLSPCSFRSNRLVYRALDPESDAQFVLDTLNDPGTQLGVNWKTDAATRSLERHQFEETR
jgi:hypothetical protein